MFLDELKASGVRHAVVWGRAVANVAESTPNDEVAEIVQDSKRCSRGSAGIRIPGPGEIHVALAEVDRAITMLGLKGGRSSRDSASPERTAPTIVACIRCMSGARNWASWSPSP
jgi:hypothetical protein